MWWDDSERLLSPLSQQVASWLHACGQRPVVLGWGPSEIGVVEALAARGIAIHASDWALNLPSYASFHVPVLQQRRPPAANAAASPQGKHTVTFLLSDGDNLQARASVATHSFNYACDYSSTHAFFFCSGLSAATLRHRSTIGGAAAAVAVWP
jgi:hypothetical protein